MKYSKKLFNSNKDAFPRIAPFALFMVFIAIQEAMQYLGTKGIVGVPNSWFLYLYPVKIVSVALLLFSFRKSYKEIACNDLETISRTTASILIGFAVFLLWINMNWTWATIGSTKGFDPTILSESFTRYIIIGFRIVGASIVVPIVEELFWRSWLLRYLVSSNFQSVELGKFTLSSFLIGTLMFGLEHNLWLAGVMAGAIYSLLLYRTKSLAQCIIAHSVTNLTLGIYILYTGKWYFW